MAHGLRVVGIGSPHGDDRIGWQLVQEVAAARPALGATVLVSPLDLLEVSLDCRLLIVVDACRTGAPVGSVIERVWPWEADTAVEHSTHGVGLTAALTLAASLGRLPAAVRLFGVEAGEGAPLGAFSPALAGVFGTLSRQLLTRLDELERCIV